MATNSSGSKQTWLVPIIVAVLGLIGTLGAAWISREATENQLQPTIIAAQAAVGTQEAAPTQTASVIEITSPPVTVVVTSPPIIVTSPPAVVTTTPIAPTSSPTPACESGCVLYEADWSKGMSGWVGGTDWKTVDNMLVNDGTGSGQPILAPYELEGITNYAIEAEIQAVRPGCEGNFYLLARTQANGEAYWAGMRGLGVGCTASVNLRSGTGSQILEEKQFNPGEEWRKYRLEVRSNTIRLLIDDGKVLETIDNRYPSGEGAGIRTREVTLNIRNFKIIKL